MVTTDPAGPPSTALPSANPPAAPAPPTPSATPPIYVSYLPIPPANRKFLRFYVPTVLWTLALLAFFWARAQQSPGTAVWEDATAKTFTGWYIHKPYPMLFADDRGDGQPGIMLLVEVGKHGVTRIQPELAGQRIELSGWLLHREGRTMIELDPLSPPLPPRPSLPLRSDQATGPRPELLARPLGKQTFQGEIVDAKCFLGAMKPGDGKTHKACAILCISGGVPPMLVVRDAASTPSFYLLHGPTNSPLDPVLRPLIGDPVDITGEVSTIGDLKLLSVLPAGVARR